MLFEEIVDNTQRTLANHNSSPWPSWISDGHNFSSFLIQKSSCCKIASFGSNRPKVWEEMSKIDFKDGGCGGHLGFLIGSVLAILCLPDVPMLLIKFQFN